MQQKFFLPQRARRALRKKNFLLIEVIVGLALFSLCALPLMRQPFILTQNSYEKLFETEIFRHAEVTHCMLLSDFQAGRIPWASLPKERKGNYPVLNTECVFDLGEEIKKVYLQTASIGFDSSKKIAPAQEARLLKLTITYSPKGSGKARTFSYFFTTVGPTLAPTINPSG